MKTFTHQFARPLKQVKENFFQILTKDNVKILGQNDELGLVSFEKDNRLFYAHFVETQKNETKVGIAPGLSYMKDRDSVNSAVIKKIFNEIEK